MGQVIPIFRTSSDVKRLHKDLASETTALGNAVTSCVDPATMAYKIDQATRDEWRVMRERVIAYLGDSPSTLRAASQYDAGAELQRELAPWHARLASAGCLVSAAPEAPPRPLSLGELLGDVEKIALLALLFFAAKELK
jgi:hypothetical protein